MTTNKILIPNETKLVGNDGVEISSSNPLPITQGFNIPQHNNGTMVEASLTDTYTFKQDVVTVAVVVFTYTDVSKTILSSWTCTL